MAKMNMLQAINSALDITMQENDNAIVFGEDVGVFGGVFRATSHLQEKYGRDRCFNTPLVEQGIIGFANGLAAQGSIAIAEIQFADYIFPAFDQIVNETAKFRYRSGNEFDVGSLVIRTPYGGGIAGGHYHSQSPEAYFSHTPGLKIVVPRDAYQAKGLLLASLQEKDPVVFFEPKRLYRASVGEVPEEAYELPIGKAEVTKNGEQVTVLAWGAQMEIVDQAVEMAEADGISCEVIDLRTIFAVGRGNCGQVGTQDRPFGYQPRSATDQWFWCRDCGHHSRPLLPVSGISHYAGVWFGYPVPSDPRKRNTCRII